MEYYGLEVSSLGVAEFYREIMGTLIIDEKDHHLKKSVEKLGIKVYCYDTLMSNLEKKKNLAKFLLEI